MTILLRLRRRLCDERGSIPVETVIVVPALTLFLLLIVAAGRLALAHTAVESAAADAARSASLARTSGEAHRNASSIATSTLTNQGVPCRQTNVAVNTAGFNVPVGLPADVSATVSCDVDMSGLTGLPGLPSYRVQATMTSPLDTYRGRR